MDIRLNSWEVPLGTNSQLVLGPVRFDVALSGGERKRVVAGAVRLPSREVRMVFRFEDEADINYFVFSGGGLSQPEYFSASLNEGKLERVIRMCLKSQQFSFGRLFYLEDELWVYGDGEACWLPLNGYRCRFTIPKKMQRATSAALFRWLQSAWGNPGSEVGFSCEWNRKTLEERHQFLGELVPRWRELSDLMQAVASVVELLEKAVWMLDHVNTHDHSPELLERLQPWRELLHAHFIPFEPLPESTPGCLGEYFGFIAHHTSVEGQHTSHHERVEAVLLLHKWLESNAPERSELLYHSQ